MKRVSILGATGSVGQSTVDLILRDPAAYDVVALTGGGNVARLAADARALNADLAVVAQEDLLPDLRAALAGSGVEAAAGRNALIEAARARATNRTPGSEIPGVPASDTSAMCFPATKSLTISSWVASLVCASYRFLGVIIS